MNGITPEDGTQNCHRSDFTAKDKRWHELLKQCENSCSGQGRSPTRPSPAKPAHYIPTGPGLEQEKPRTMEAVPSHVIFQDDIHDHVNYFFLVTRRLDLTACRESRGACNQTPPSVHCSRTRGLWKGHGRHRLCPARPPLSTTTQQGLRTHMLPVNTRGQLGVSQGRCGTLSKTRGSRGHSAPCRGPSGKGPTWLACAFMNSGPLGLFHLSQNIFVGNRGHLNQNQDPMSLQESGRALAAICPGPAAASAEKQAGPQGCSPSPAALQHPHFREQVRPQEPLGKW